MGIESRIAEASEKYDSFYLYDEANIIGQADKLKASFLDVTFLYSLKCNPNKHVVSCVFRQGFGTDAASRGEVFLAQELVAPFF